MCAVPRYGLSLSVSLNLTLTLTLSVSDCVSDIVGAWPRQLTEAGCPDDQTRLMNYCVGLGPAGPSSCEDQGATAMDYMASIYGMYRALSQVANFQLDFIDEDTLTAEGLKPYKALIVTEPDVPVEGQAAIVQWMKAGGHLLTTMGASTADRYDQPSTLLTTATGIRLGAWLCLCLCLCL